MPKHHISLENEQYVFEIISQAYRLPMTLKYRQIKKLYDEMDLLIYRVRRTESVEDLEIATRMYAATSRVWAAVSKKISQRMFKRYTRFGIFRLGGTRTHVVEHYGKRTFNLKKGKKPRTPIMFKVGDPHELYDAQVHLLTKTPSVMLPNPMAVYVSRSTSTQYYTSVPSSTTSRSTEQFSYGYEEFLHPDDVQEAHALWQDYKSFINDYTFFEPMDIEVDPRDQALFSLLDCAGMLDVMITRLNVLSAEIGKALTRILKLKKGGRETWFYTQLTDELFAYYGISPYKRVYPRHINYQFYDQYPVKKVILPPKF